MSQSVPVDISQTLEQLGRALQSVGGQPIDPLTSDWSAMEPGIARLLGGAFNGQNPKHVDIAFALGLALGERLGKELGGFWFSNRAAPAGISLGFADAIIMVSPFELSLQALGRSKLGLFDQVKKDLGDALDRGRAGRAMNLGARKLEPDDYEHMFDPALVQFVALDAAKAETAWRDTAGQVARDIESAFTRVSARLPEQAKREMKAQLVGALQRLDGESPFISQAAKVPGMFALVALLHGQKQATGFAAAELWQGILLPLLHIGAAKDFPPLDEDELEAYRKGVEPLLIFADTVPYQTPTADEDGLLGVFPDGSVAPLDAALQDVPGQRLLKLSPEPLIELCASFEASALRDSLERFTAHLEQQAGGRPAASATNGQAPPMTEVAVRFLGELVGVVKKVQDEQAILCIRQATAAEAASEGALGELRQAMQAGPIILV